MELTSCVGERGFLNTPKGARPFFASFQRRCPWIPVPDCKFLHTSSMAPELGDKILHCAHQEEVAPIPEGSLPLQLLKDLETRGDEVVLIDGISGEELTCSLLKKQAVNVASGLRRRGLKPGDRVLIITSNCILFPSAFLGVTLSAGVLSMANPSYIARELIHQVKDSGATWLIVGQGQEDKAREVAQRLGTIRDMFLLQGEAKGFTPYSLLLKDPGDMWTPYTQVDAEKDLLLLPYSSGTTGLPKGVMLTHRNLAVTHSFFRTNAELRLTPDDVSLVILPMYHIFGFTMIFNAMIRKNPTVFLSGFEPAVFLRTIEKYRVTFIPMVPPIVVHLSQDPQVDDYDLSSIRLITIGSAPLSASVQDKFQQRLGPHVNVEQGYGLTETVFAITICSPGSKKGSVGRVPSHTMVKVVDTETRERLGPHQPGEICMRGPHATPGYYNNTKATAELFDEEGWLRTGDIGYYDEDGYFFILDRIKELIKYKAFQVAPAELEGILLSHPAVSDAGVVGRPDARAGELPMAFVVLKPEASATEEELKHFVETQVSNHKKLRGGVIIVDSIPRNPSGKILRRALREKAKSLRAKL